MLLSFTAESQYGRKSPEGKQAREWSQIKGMSAFLATECLDATHQYQQTQQVKRQGEGE